MTEDNFEKFLKSCIKNCKPLIYKLDVHKQYLAIPLLLMICARDNKEQLIK